MESTEKIVLILCGLIGSGKSTFAKALQDHFPSFVRCNQDELGTRRDVEDLVHGTLNKGLSVCVDRTNVDENQRRTWVSLGRRYPGTQIWALVFDTPYDICVARLMTRTDHPTITSPELGLEVLSRFAREFQPPTEGEGFDRILFLQPNPSGTYTRDDLLAVLNSIRASPTLSGRITTGASQSYGGPNRWQLWYPPPSEQSGVSRGYPPSSGNSPWRH